MPPGISFFSASRPKILISIGVKSRISCKALSLTRWPKLRTSVPSRLPLPNGRGSEVFILLAALALTGCRQDMHDQPKYKYLRSTEFFTDGRSARPLVENTIARGHLDEDSVFYRSEEHTSELQSLRHLVCRL